VVRGLWSEVNETTHATLVAILKDETGPALSTTDGAVTLELGELVKQVGKEFGISSDVLDKLPEDIGRVTIVESEELAAAQDAVRLIEILSVVVFLLVLLLYVAAVYLAGQRRREAIREVGFALVIGSVLVLVGLRVAAGAVAGSVGEASGAEGAARAVTEIGTELLRGIFMAGLVFGALIAGFAALAGPSNIAKRLREMLVPVLLAKPIVAWSAAIGVFLLVMYLVPSEPLQSWWRGLIFIALFAAAIEALRRQLAREFPEALSASAVPEDTVPEDAVPEDAVPAGSDASG
jgi:MFS family permease